MGCGLSSERMQNQEAYVRKNLQKEKNRLSCFKNLDGSQRYSDNQIEMKIRQEYNTCGNIKYHYDKDSYIPYSHWKS